MNDAVELLVRYGEAVVFAVVLAEQIGLPVPAVPVLLAAGALAGAGKISLASAILLSLVACFAGDLVWYELGRYRGRQALNLLCRIALEPDSCVRRTENFFGRHGLLLTRPRQVHPGPEHDHTGPCRIVRSQRAAIPALQWAGLASVERVLHRARLSVQSSTGGHGGADCAIRCGDSPAARRGLHRLRGL